VLGALHRIQEMFRCGQLLARRGTQFLDPYEKLPSARYVDATKGRHENDCLCDVDSDHTQCPRHSLAPALVDERDCSECSSICNDRCLPWIEPRYRLESDTGRPNDGRTRVSNRAKAQMWSPARPRT
jgi:hypothetical protein